MKKALFILSLLVTSLQGFAESRVWVSPLEIMPGEKGYLRVNYEFDAGHTICNYQMKVNLPDGVTVDGTSVVLGSCHTGHTGSIVNNVLVVTSMNAVLQGTSGVLVEIPVVADGSLTAGTKLEGNLENVKLGQTNETSINSTGITFDVDIVDYILLDEDAITAPQTSSAKKVKVKRTIKAGEWSTLCLPFDMTADEVKSIFGNDVKLACFVGYGTTKDGSDVTGININFEEDDLSEDFSGNYPYMILTSNDITEFTITKALNFDDVVEVYKPGKKTMGQFIGTYQAETVVPENSLFISDNKYYYSKGKTKMQGFRAYFALQDILSNVANAATRITMSFGGETTGIQEVRGSSVNMEGIYDLQGRQVTNPVKKGLYIKNGKKTVIK